MQPSTKAFIQFLISVTRTFLYINQGFRYHAPHISTIWILMVFVFSKYGEVTPLQIFNGKHLKKTFSSD